MLPQGTGAPSGCGVAPMKFKFVPCWSCGALIKGPEQGNAVTQPTPVRSKQLGGARPQHTVTIAHKTQNQVHAISQSMSEMSSTCKLTIKNPNNFMLRYTNGLATVCSSRRSQDLPNIKIVPWCVHETRSCRTTCYIELRRSSG